jgi:hypothetical protein
MDLSTPGRQPVRSSRERGILGRPLPSVRRPRRRTHALAPPERKRPCRARAKDDTKCWLSHPRLTGPAVPDCDVLP